MEDLQALFEQSSDAPSEENDKDILLDAQSAVLQTMTLIAMEQEPNPFEFLSVDHFTDPLFAIMFDILDSSLKSGERFSIIPYMNEDIGKVFSNFLTTSNSLSYNMAKSYAYALDDEYRKRKVLEHYDNLGKLIKSSKSFTDVSKALDCFHQDAQSMAHNPFIQKTSYTHNEALNEFLDDYLSPEEDSIITGLQSLDDYLGGFLPGDLVIIGGRPGMGKTAFLIMLIANAALSGRHIMNFSFEMSNRQTMARFLSLDARLNDNDDVAYTNLTKRKVDSDKVIDMVENSKSRRCNIYHEYNSSLTVDGIINRAERKAKELTRMGQKLDMLCIDYLQIIPKDNGNRNENEMIGDITTKLKNFAKKLKVPILLLSQLNRKVEEAHNIEDKRPNNSHLRQSGSIEQDADIILFPFRPAQYERDKDEMTRKYKPDYMEVIVSKNRQGAIGIAKAKCFIGQNYICDRDYGDDGLTGNVIEHKSKRGSL